MSINVATYLANPATYNSQPGGVIIADVANVIALQIDQLNNPNITSISITDSAVINITVAQLTTDAVAISKLSAADNTPYRLSIGDSGTNVQNNLTTLSANIAHISAIVLISGSVTVSTAAFLANQSALDKITGKFAISDTVANIRANIAAIQADQSHIRAVITPWNGTNAITLPVTNGPGTTALPGRTLTQIVANGNIQFIDNYFENFAGNAVAQPVHYDTYKIDMFGNPVSGPTLNSTIEATNPTVVSTYGNQFGSATLGGTPTSFMTYWDAQNPDGSYKVYYSITNAITGVSTAAASVFDSVFFPPAPTDYAPAGNVGYVILANIGNGNLLIGAHSIDPISGVDSISLRLYDGATGTFGAAFPGATFSDSLQHSYGLGQWGTNYALTAVSYSGAGASQVANVQISQISPTGVIGAPVTVATGLGSIDQITWAYNGTQATGNNTGANYWVMAVDGKNTAGTRVHNLYQVNATTGAINGTFSLNYNVTVTQEAQIRGGNPGNWIVFWVDAGGLTIGSLTTNASNVPFFTSTINIPTANSLANVQALGDGRIVVTWRVTNGDGGVNNVGLTGSEYAEIFDLRSAGVNGNGIALGGNGGTTGYIAGTAFADRITHTAGTQVINGAGGTDTYALSLPASQVSATVNADGTVTVVTPDGTDTLIGFTTITLSDGTITIAGNTLTLAYTSGASTVSMFNITGKPFAATIVVYDATNTLTSETFNKADGSLYLAYTPGPITAAAYHAAPLAYNAIPGGFTINDTAANIAGVLDELTGAPVNAIIISDNAAVVLNVAQLTGDAAQIAKLQNANATAYSLSITDSGTNIVSGLAALTANVSQITAINSTSIVSVNVAQFLANRTALDKIPNKFSISDTAANIQANFANISADQSHIRSVIAPWANSTPTLMSVTNSPSSSFLAARASNQYIYNGTLNLNSGYYENYAGSGINQPIHFDSYKMDPFGRLTSGPTLNSVIEATSPMTATPYGTQYGSAFLGSTSQMSVAYWDAVNPDGSYKVYYSVTNATTGASTAAAIAFSAVYFPPAPTDYAPSGNIGFVQIASLGDGTAVIGSISRDQITNADTISLKFYDAISGTFGPAITGPSFSDGLGHLWGIGQWGTGYALTTVTYSGAPGSQLANVTLTSVSTTGTFGSPVTFATGLGSIDQISWGYSSAATGNNAGANFWVLAVDGKDAAGNRVHNLYQANAATGAINSTLSLQYNGTVTQEARVIGVPGGWVVYWVDSGGLAIGNVAASGNNLSITSTTRIPQANGIANVQSLGDGRVLATWRETIFSGTPNGSGSTGFDYAEIFDTRISGINGTGTVVGNGTPGYISGTSFNDTITHTAGTQFINGGGGTDTYSLNLTKAQIIAITNVNVDGSVRIATSDGVDTLTNFSSITATDGTLKIAGTVTAARFASVTAVSLSDTIGRYTINDTAANIRAALANIQANPAYIKAVITPWNNSAAIVLPVTNDPGTTSLPGRALGPMIAGNFQLFDTYFQNFAGTNVAQNWYIDSYKMDPFGKLVAGPTLNQAVAATTPKVIPAYESQAGQFALGGASPSYVTYWDSRNLDGSYKVYYSLTNATTGVSTPAAIAFAAANFAPPPTAYAPNGNVGNVQAAQLLDGNAMFGVETLNGGTETITLELLDGTTGTVGAPFNVASFTDGLNHYWSIGRWGTNYGLTTVTYSGTGGSQLANITLTPISPTGFSGAPVTFATGMGSIDQISWSYVGNQATGNNSGANYWALAVDGADVQGNRVHNIYQANAATGAINGTLSLKYNGTVTQEARIVGGNPNSWDVFWVDASGLTVATVSTFNNIPVITSSTNIPTANSIANVQALGDNRLLVTWRVVTSAGQPNNAGNTGIEYAEIFDTRGTGLNGTGIAIGGGPVAYIAGTVFNDNITHTAGAQIINGGGGSDFYNVGFTASQVTASVNSDGSVTLITPDGTDTLIGFTTINLSNGQISISGNTLIEGHTDGSGVTSTFNITGQPYVKTIVVFDTNSQLVSVTNYKADGSVYNPNATNGVAVDGYIVGATVFADANGNGVWDAGEAKTITDANGQFTLVGGSGELILTGGIDSSTGLAFAGKLQAPEGYTVITPITTLVAALAPDNATPAEIQAAEQKVIAAFSLTLANGQSLSTLDPIAGAIAGDPASLAVYTAGSVVYDTVVMAAAALAGATGVTGAEAALAVVNALADKIDNATPGTTVNLGDLTTVEQIVRTAKTDVDPTDAHPISSSDIGKIANVVTASNTDLVEQVQNAPDPTSAISAGSSVQAAAISDTAEKLTDLSQLDTILAKIGGAADFSSATGGVYAVLSANLQPGNTSGYAYKTTTPGASFRSPATAGAYTFVNLAGYQNVIGSNFNDRLYGTTASNIFAPNAGSDIVYGEGGSDTVDYTSITGGVFVDLAASYAYKTTGGASFRNGAAGITIDGTDTLIAIANVTGSNFNDRLYGTTGNNIFTPNAGNDIIYGQGGSDTVSYASMTGAVFVDLAGRYAYKTTGGASFLNGGAGVTIAWTDSLNGISNVIGSGFNDRLYGTTGDNIFAPGAGSDIIYGEGGTDTVDYSDAAGGVFVDLAARTAYETTGGTSFRNGAAGVSIASTDSLNGISIAKGSAFNDRLYSAPGGSALYGGDGIDVLYGVYGYDTLDGGNGADLIIAGGAGHSTLTGGAGADQFIFSAMTSVSNTVTDFTSGTDTIGLSNGVYGDYTTGQTISLHSGAGLDAAAIYGNSGEGFSYSTTTGSLWFNADWSNPGGAVQVATLDNAPNLTATDFTVL